MRKSVNLTLRVEVAGEDEPAHDFASSSIEAVRDIISAGRWRHPSLTVTVKDVKEDTVGDDESSG
jgi:hypothetical protein